MEFQSTSFLIFVTIYLIVFDCVSLSDLNSNLNSFMEILSIRHFFGQFIRRFFDGPKYLIVSFKNITFFFARISSNKCAAKFFFSCFLHFYFIVKISVPITIFNNFYCKFMVIKI